ncbi:hypothetical protein A2U01_0066722 [Trifolium medium]|uniref:Uncharacterized protein n=1 Tax=Trifolium medium TaxID=97028 RepID=A0A392S963_9FABA|nr:hypothetical protein [Trifolium medium]
MMRPKFEAEPQNAGLMSPGEMCLTFLASSRQFSPVNLKLPDLVSPGVRPAKSSDRN